MSKLIEQAFKERRAAAAADQRIRDANIGNIDQENVDMLEGGHRSMQAAAAQAAAERRRLMDVEVKIIDAENGLVDYIASDESIDSYREIVRVKGWRFNRFEKNAPFVDSHNYCSVTSLLGRVIDWRIRKGQLIERVQWAIEDPEHTIAQIGWKLTKSGYLKAVSVGFLPIKWVSRWSSDAADFNNELDRLGLDGDSEVQVIYLQQEQLELSACVVGANGNAVAKAYKADALNDEDLDILYQKSNRLTGNRTIQPGNGAPPLRQATSHAGFLHKLKQLINQ